MAAALDVGGITLLPVLRACRMFVDQDRKEAYYSRLIRLIHIRTDTVRSLSLLVDG